MHTEKEKLINKISELIHSKDSDNIKLGIAIMDNQSMSGDLFYEYSKERHIANKHALGEFLSWKASLIMKSNGYS